MSTTAPAIPVTSTLGSVAVELRPLGPRRTLVSTPDDQHFAIDVDGHTAVRLVDAVAEFAAVRADPAVTGPRPVPNGWRDDDWTEAVGALSALLAEHAGPGAAPEGTPWQPDGERSAPALHVTGDPELVAALLADPRATSWQPVAGELRTAVHRAFAAQQPLVVCHRGAPAATLAEVDKLCADARLPWIAVHLQRNRTWIGPWVHPGRGANHLDLAARLLSNAVDPEVHLALQQPALGPDCGAAPAALPGWASDVHATLADPVFAAGDLAVELGPWRRAVAHPVLPLPAPDAVPARSHPIEDLVDPRTGIVRRTRSIGHHPSVPSNLRTVQADVCTIRRVSRWANNTSCQGSVFDDPVRARQAAIGEAVERYCGNLLDTLPVESGSYRTVRRRLPGRVLDPDEVVLYSDRQYAAPGFPFVRMTHDLEIGWVPGHSLTTDEPVWVPASLVYVNWFTGGRAGAPVTNFCPFAGIAAGPTLEFAITSALEEVIERHASMVWWLNRQPLDAYAPSRAMTDLWSRLDPAWDQEWSVIGLDNEYGIPVAAGVLVNPVDQLLNIGFSARPTMELAAAKAWTEALTLAEGSRDLLPRDGRHWAAMARGELNGRSFKPWRADRRYLDDFRADFHDCDDLMVQQQVHLDPRAQQQVSELWSRPAVRDLAGAPRVADRTVAAYRERVEGLGQEVIVVDITSADVAATGMRVVRVIVPGTVGNAPAAFPFLGGGVLQQRAVDLGWRSTPLAEEELNLVPLPHA